jgi:hypothetical protein
MQPITIAALVIFIVIYALMLTFQKYRPWIALGGAAIFIILVFFHVYPTSLPRSMRSLMSIITTSC